MSSTRKAKDSSVFHQNRFASSPEFERGLLANLVAKRCALIDDPAQRELLWFIQYLSHQAGGLAAFAKHVIAEYPERIQTREMVAMGLSRGEICNAEQVRRLREGFPNRGHFVLKDEVCDSVGSIREPLLGDSEWDISDETEIARKNPTHYASDAFFDRCEREAVDELEKYLSCLCLDPEISLADGPWYFHRLIETLRDVKNDLEKKKSSAVVTALGERVCETLEYTAYCRGLTLMEGEARTGKSFAARAWCAQRPGRARFIEVPPGNDEIGFLRAIAQGVSPNGETTGLGLGNFLNYKTTEIRARVESVLRAGDLMIVLDEAQRLWPQCNIRYGAPNRIAWVMKWANDGVPISLIATPQFIETQKAMEKRGWNSAQLTGRISHYEPLPIELPDEDLEAVAYSMLPGVEASAIRALATYAKTSSRYLQAVDSIAKRARFIAERAGRPSTVVAEDVRQAMQSSVIPSDSRLQSALDAGRTKKAREASLAVAAPAPAETIASESVPVGHSPRATRPVDALPSNSGRFARAGIGAVLNGH